MQSFLEDVIKEISQKHSSLENMVFLLPNKRAGTFLRNSIAKSQKKTQFSPDILSIETFVEKISGLAYASNTQQLFELYNAYLNTEEKEKDSFATFSKWGQTLLQDFNEIDRFLVDTTKLFSHLSAIQEINHWYLQKERTQLIEDHIRFWNNLESLYQEFNNNLLVQGLGHQGQIYRKACSTIETYLEANTSKKHIFIGFNALNAAETYIIKKVLSTSDAEIYWDIDPCFIADPIHDAGYFIRKHLKWSYYTTNSPKGLKTNYRTKKNIQIIGVPKNVSQANYVGNLLGELDQKDHNQLKNTAVVLGDETLLNPILNAIPKEINSVNITMGYPLDKTPLANLFLEYIDLYLGKEQQGWFYKELISFLNNSYVQILLTDGTCNNATLLAKRIRERNWTYIDPEKLEIIGGDAGNIISQLFFKEAPSTLLLLEKITEIISGLRAKFQETKNTLGLEYLYRFYNLFNQIKALVPKYPFLNDIRSLQNLFKQLLTSETLDFRGEPLQGLQIMGMLESRNLDFETVILTSINEGILPSGKSNNSFIPFDIKLGFQMPTYKEKDAVYTYHFYRLLQRAKNIYILYNTEPDVLEGGEKSRLIMQLLTDEDNTAQITEILAAPLTRPTIKAPQIVAKDPELVQAIKSLMGNGVSPTSLTNYIRNPIDFYKKHILRIRESLDVEETVAANTLGTIVHDVLEQLYTPLVGQYLTSDNLKALKVDLNTVIRHHFSKNYSDGDISKGKNLIAYNVVLRYVENFIDSEIRATEKAKIKILALEKSLEAILTIPNLNFPIRLKGKLDRIDEVDGIVRIIDYKTGSVLPSQVKINTWETLIKDYNKSKAFQLLCYALLYTKGENTGTFEAGIISIKNPGKGLFKFSHGKSTLIDPVILSNFHEALNVLITEICNPEIAFAEKEV
ncbi:PD-(D/E)XK nuclease family protein [Spongiimicrobium sp. 3-5]|uniref:PD-(D/E)XK nuclease family protein n=1 Tax=Spongiimicrobium sp. 3-5 TaxID=3332596 RepID=UPI00397F3B5E